MKCTNHVILLGIGYETWLTCDNEDASRKIFVATENLVFDFELCIGGWCLRVYTYRSFSLSLQVCVCYHRTVVEQQRPAVEYSVGPRGDGNSGSQWGELWTRSLVSLSTDKYRKNAGKYRGKIGINREKRSGVYNGNNVGSVLLWDTGTPKTWAWDRLTVDLREGDNQIRIQANGRIMMDHVNIHYVGQYSYSK